MPAGATQDSLLGFNPYTVDAISWTPIRLTYAYRDLMEGTIENTGAVTVNLRTLDTDSTHERTLLSGEVLPWKIGPRNQHVLTDDMPPICYAKAASGTCTLMVTER